MTENHNPLIVADPQSRFSIATRIWFDQGLFETAKTIAKYLSDAAGFVPKHLEGKPAACFAVVVRSLTWGLDPYAVANATYQTPGGRVGFEGKLCQAVLENSGRVKGQIKFTYYGDWNKVKGKFEIRQSDKGTKYPVPTWTREDAKGLGVTVSAQIIGEDEPRTMDYDLDTAFPLNSTLWATRPHQQILYTAIRAFANICAPGIFMGTPFDHEPDDGPMVDVTPKRPTRDQFEDASKATEQVREEEKAVELPFEWIGREGDITPVDAETFAATLLGVIEKGDAGWYAIAWENNSGQIALLDEATQLKIRDMAEARTAAEDRAKREAQQVKDEAAKPQEAPPAQESQPPPVAANATPTAAPTSLLAPAALHLKDGRNIDLTKAIPLPSSPKRGPSASWTEDAKITEWCVAMMQIADKAPLEHVPAWLELNETILGNVAKMDKHKREAANVRGAFQRRLDLDTEAPAEGDSDPLPEFRDRSNPERKSLFDQKG